MLSLEVNVQKLVTFQYFSDSGPVFEQQTFPYTLDQLFTVVVLQRHSDKWFDVVKINLFFYVLVRNLGINKRHAVEYNQPDRKSVTNVVIVQGVDSFLV